MNNKAKIVQSINPQSIIHQFYQVPLAIQSTTTLSSSPSRIYPRCIHHLCRRHSKMAIKQASFFFLQKDIIKKKKERKGIKSIHARFMK